MNCRDQHSTSSSISQTSPARPSYVPELQKKPHIPDPSASLLHQHQPGFLLCVVSSRNAGKVGATECSELKGTHKDHQIQLLALHRTTQKSDHMSESGVQILL